MPDLDLTEEDDTLLIPTQLKKYVRYATLARAFGRQGEGRQPILATHYDRRFTMGTIFFRKMADQTHLDKDVVRQDATPSRKRPPLVRLPSTFPRVW